MNDRDEPMPPERDPNDRDVDERSISQVRGPNRQTNVLVVIFGVAIVGLLLWFVNRGETPKDNTRLTTPTDLDFEPAARHEAAELEIPAPPPTPEPTAASSPDPFELEMRRMALRQAQEAQKLAEKRRRAPILIVDKRSDRGIRHIVDPAGTDTAAPNASAPSEGSEQGLAAELAPASADLANVKYLADKSHTVAQGTLIRGVLETAIQSDLPGMVRAEVAHDVYAFDGSRVLIPKASRLVGQYRSGLVRGQTRVFIVWDRLLRPDGASILIGSAGTDLLGRAGLEGDLDTHFFKIFGASVLLSLVDGAISVAVENARSDNNAGTTTILQNASSLNRAADIALENSITIPPTIHVDQGTPIQVFVARDLNFRNVTPQ